jgi:hypothetical protein
LRLQPTAGGTSSEELVYFEALSLQKTGNAAGAKAAWQRLAANRESYYGQLAVQRLNNTATSPSTSDVCSNISDRTREEAITRLMSQRRPLLAEPANSRDLVAELMFLQLWDEAAYWIDQGRRPNATLGAD